MPEITNPRQPDNAAEEAPGSVAERVRSAGTGLAALLEVAADARSRRTEADGSSAVCAWNHFENIPTFYNWNNRPSR
ncbi:multiple cyclophane-containing RiPP AmcA [Catenuloplanes japonicus]|uniref:multiple cyclophane-containing RiPP AmcA n=1 Tax=Catenuloplanes japonicus TaxID=33876 RepID=UPI0005259803|nr:multiple cyclophane-containing RiPP AmcA [Catenuloplanes japonicus]